MFFDKRLNIAIQLSGRIQTIQLYWIVEFNQVRLTYFDYWIYYFSEWFGHSLLHFLQRMRSILASNFTKNISRTAKSTCSFPGYSYCSNKINNLYSSQCINLDETEAYAIYPPVRVEDMNGAVTEDVYVISGGCYLISGITAYSFIYPATASVEQPVGQIDIKLDVYFVSKQNAELNLKLDYDVKLDSNYNPVGSGEVNQFYVININKTSDDMII